MEIRDEYIARNMYLYIFEISAPRGFGEQWAQGHLKEDCKIYLFLKTKATV